MRFILGFIGAVFALILTISLISGLSTYFSSPPAPLASDVFHKEPKELHLASDGPFGKFDNSSCSGAFRCTLRFAPPATASSLSHSMT